MAVKYIVTHPGSAHKDDFLACCVLIHRHQVAVVRREPNDADLADPDVLVVDVGGKHEPKRGNFDHHQFPRDHEPICALSLVLKHLGIYEDALTFCDWLKPAEWFDSRGPGDTAKWLGVERSVMSQLLSPIDVTMLRRFAMRSQLDLEEPLWQMMEYVGHDLLSYLNTMRSRLAFISQHAKFWTVKGKDGKDFEIVFLQRIEPLPEDGTMALPRFIDEKGKADSVVGMVYPDRRGSGYAMSRYNDKLDLDFSPLEESEDDVHFAHARGFVAKTSATDLDRIRELLVMAHK